MAFPLGLPLKRFYKYLLKRVIGSFLKRDLDLEQLEVQLYQGLVQLKSLELDVTPLQLPAGLRCEAAVACVKMDVPWRRLVSDHCKVYVSGLHLVLTRGQDVKYQAPEPLKPPGGFFAEAPEEASRYSDDGIETLSRLVKRVLSRMQVCLQDASITVQLPPGALRARLSSALLFSDTSTEESVKSRTLRVGSFNLSMLPPPNLEEAGHGTGELVLMSSRGQEASAGVLVLQRRKQIAGGVHFDASLHLPAVRVALAPASCHALAEVLLSLSQAGSEKVPDIEELEKSSEKAEEPPLSPRPPSMVQSLVFQPETTSNIWHDLYRLFEADAQLDAATEGGSEAVEGEDDPLDMQEQEAFQDALEGEGWEAPSGAQWLSLKVLVDQSSAVLCLPRAEVGEDIWRHAAHHPQPRAVTFAAPMQRPEHQAQLCLAGICFTLEKQLKPEQAVPPNWGVSAECIEVHLHRRVHDDAREEAQEEEEEETPAPAGAALGVSYVASDLWRSALSREGVEGNRTPSAPSEQCDTEESEGDESESFGESSVHSFGDTTPAASGVQQADDDEGIDDSDQELQDAFFDRQRGIDWLLPKLQARRPPAACRRHWRRSAPHFLSKQVVTFVTADRGSNSARSWPPAPIPDAGHPIWPTLGLGDQRRHLWVRHEVEEATASSSIRMSCLPLQLSVCAKTVQMLLQAVDSWKLAKTKSISEPGEASPSSPSSPRRNPEPPRLPTFVAIAPAIRLILRLPDGSSAVGDVVLPRLSAPSRPAAETDYEALRLEAASATVCLAAAKVKDLVSLRPKPGSPGVVHRNGLELSLFVSASGETSAAKPAEVSEEAAHAAEPAVPSDWTRYSAVGKPRPGGSAQGSHAARPAPTEDRLPHQEKPPEPDRDLEDTSLEPERMVSQAQGGQLINLDCDEPQSPRVAYLRRRLCFTEKPDGGQSSKLEWHMYDRVKPSDDVREKQAQWARTLDLFGQPDRVDRPSVQTFLDEGVEEIVEVPRSAMARVIGKKGRTIAEVRSKSGAWKVDARDQSKDPCEVKLQGPPEAVQKAKELIHELLKPLSERHAGAQFVDISQGQIGKIIGAKGARVQEIELQTGVKIDVDYSCAPCRAYLMGSDSEVRVAKRLLLEIANEA
ncbi:unnamed protein product [Effrenium voratum]|nr:unnamed protein product [Effrenium voratum]